MITDTLDLFTFCTTIVVLVICVVSDVLFRKVKNYIVFPAILIGIVCSFFISPQTALWRMLWLFVLFLFGSFRLMGMGDLKLCMAVTALRGPEEMAFMLLFGSVTMIIYCLFTDTKKMLNVLGDTGLFIMHGIPIRKQSDKKYPFAVFLAIGYVIEIVISMVFKWI